MDIKWVKKRKRNVNCGSCCCRKRYSQWGNLPGDILALIFKCLNTKTDFFRLSAVCSSWRSSLSHLKCFSYPQTISHFGPTETSPPELPPPYDLVHKIFFFVSRLDQKSSDLRDADSIIWLAQLSVKRESKSWSLLNLHPKNSRSFHVLPELNRLNFLNYQLVEVCDSYDLGDTSIYNPKNEDYWIQKLVFFPNTGAVGDDFVFLALYGYSRLAVWSKHSDWCFVNDEFEEGDEYYAWFSDIISCNGKLYAVKVTGALYMVLQNEGSLTDSWWTQKVTSCSFYGHDFLDRVDERWLVTYEERRLYLIFRGYFNKDIVFKVYVLNEEVGKWETIKSIDEDVVFFIIENDYTLTFSVSAKDLPWCSGTCIYYSSEVPGVNKWEFWESTDEGFSKKASWEMESTALVSYLVPRS